MSRDGIPATPLQVAETYLGLSEKTGALNNPTVVGMLQSVDPSVEGDDVPWCSAFIHACCAPFDLPVTNSLRARSWLRIGDSINLANAEPGFDLVILRAKGTPLDPNVIGARGHVAWFVALLDGDRVELLGGNQRDRVSSIPYPRADVIGVRRLRSSSEGPIGAE